MYLNRKIFVTFQIEGFHAYPDAPAEVAYLRERHRHMFHYKVALAVAHNEREVEFHIFRKWLLSLFGEKVLEANNKSCEKLAEDLLNRIKSDRIYGWFNLDHTRERHIQVEVSEDGENGAIISTI